MENKGKGKYTFESEDNLEAKIRKNANKLYNS